MSDLSKRSRSEWLGKQMNRWIEAAEVSAVKIPRSNFLLSAKAATKEKNIKKDDVRQVAHSWCASTLALTWVLVRMSLCLGRAARWTAAALLRSFIYHYFSAVAKFCFDVSVQRSDDFPASSMPAQHVDSHEYREVEIQRGLLQVSDIHTHVPKGRLLTKAMYVCMYVCMNVRSKQRMLKGWLK